MTLKCHVIIMLAQKYEDDLILPRSLQLKSSNAKVLGFFPDFVLEKAFLPCVWISSSMLTDDQFSPRFCPVFFNLTAEGLDWMTFKSPFQTKLFYCSMSPSKVLWWQFNQHKGKIFPQTCRYFKNTHSMLLNCVHIPRMAITENTLSANS